jgi:predicted RNase H-like HicB family nuclease
MLQYKAGYKYVDTAVHAQVLDFPAAITCADDLESARRLLAIALLDVAETALELGVPIPRPDPLQTNPEMDIEEPIYLHLHVSTDVQQTPAGVIVP